jgi:diadenosine tetraphosphate (Ap4A) HIT family hydrolase
MAAECPLCASRDAPALWRDARLRVVDAGEPGYPGFLRVVWAQHVREMTDLAPGDQQHCLAVVLAAERALRTALRPEKINLAALGNQVPHLHWHVIPRVRDDAHFPQSVWSAPVRTPATRSFDAALVRRLLAEALGAPVTP